MRAMMTTTTATSLIAFSLVATAASAFSTFGGSSAAPIRVQLQSPHQTATALTFHRNRGICTNTPQQQAPAAVIRGRREKNGQKSSPSSQLQAAALLPPAISIVAPHVWTSLLPPFLGFYKSEYTVSLGYGFAVALTALSLLRQQQLLAIGGTNPPLLLTLHASALIFYGARLNLFLILRNVWSSRIQQFNTNIEDRAIARGNRWTTRAPFIVSCGLLYYGLTIPLWFTGKMMLQSGLAGSSRTSWIAPLFKALIGAQWLGFGIAALGDFTKTFVKGSEKNERYLVTSGIFSWIRHPNYTGEILGWTANALAGLVAAALWIPTVFSFSFSPSSSTTMRSVAATSTMIANLAALVVGWLGIWFVLLRATSNLEARQKADYGHTPKYQEWVASSWGGWQLTTKQKMDESDHVTPQLELDDTVEEGSGSGI